MMDKTITELKAWKDDRDIKDDAVLQVRVHTQGGVLHLQGFGEQFTNRPYGFAMKFSVPEEITNWLTQQTPMYMSFASAEIIYIRGITVKSYDDGMQLVIYSPEEGNCNGSWVLDLHKEKENIVEFIDFLQNNELITTVKGNRWIGDE